MRVDGLTQKPRPSTFAVAAVAALTLASGGCQEPTKGVAADAAGATAKAKGPGLGEVMVGVGRRFEIAGRAVVAGRFALAAFEVGEIEEAFEDDVPGAELPKEGPTAHIPAFAAAFLKNDVPALKAAAKGGDRKAFDAAYATAATACNTCHKTSEKGFIEIPTVPGKEVPLVDDKGVPGDRGVTVKSLPLPGGNGPAALDYIAYEPGPGSGRVWVPAGATGNVDVFDVDSGTFHAVAGWKTAEREGHSGKRVVGPSSVAIGDGFAYVGNRAADEVCGVDRKTLTRGPCLALKTGVDGIEAVPSAHEIWVTTPADDSLTVLREKGGGNLEVGGTVKVGGKPEGYAVDEVHGLFFTNLEDKAKTVAVDVKTRTVRSTWKNGCGEEGPRGVAVDGARSLVMVACTDHVEVLDAAHDGALLEKQEAGSGVDNIDYKAASALLYVAAGKAGRLTVFHVGPKGELTVVRHAETKEGARNAVADSRGAVYVADSKGASLMVVPPPP